MDSIYWIIIVALLLLAAFDLINGVANDAVNFLNSAIGSKAPPSGQSWPWPPLASWWARAFPEA